MAKYFFHLRDGEDVVLDPDGIECADMKAIVAKTLEAARDLIAGDVKLGWIDLAYRIDVEDAAGAVVHSLPFTEAITIRRE